MPFCLFAGEKLYLVFLRNADPALICHTPQIIIMQLNIQTASWMACSPWEAVLLDGVSVSALVLAEVFSVSLTCGALFYIGFFHVGGLTISLGSVGKAAPDYFVPHRFVNRRTGRGGYSWRRHIVVVNSGPAEEEPSHLSVSQSRGSRCLNGDGCTGPLTIGGAPGAQSLQSHGIRP